MTFFCFYKHYLQSITKITRYILNNNNKEDERKENTASCIYAVFKPHTFTHNNEVNNQDMIQMEKGEIEPFIILILKLQLSSRSYLDKGYELYHPN